MVDPQSLKVLQVSSSRMEFFFEQIRILEEMGIDCDVVCYPSNPPEAETEVRREKLHDGILNRIYGHNPLYYLARGAHFYPRILRSAIETDYDIIHVNSGMVAPLGLLQPQRPVVLTLWGDDLLGDRLGGYQSEITKRCANRSDSVIVRNQEMREALTCDSSIIPSGIDMEKFAPIDQEEAREAIGWSQTGHHVLFPYPAYQDKKRYPVAKDIVDHIDRRMSDEVTLQAVHNVPHEKMYLYYNAADVLLLPSLREGSPNTVKEAMACNVPVVSTDVGDVRTRLAPVSNSYVCMDQNELEEGVFRVLRTGERSDGRNHVSDVSLERMGELILSIYESVLDRTEDRTKTLPSQLPITQ